MDVDGVISVGLEVEIEIWVTLLSFGVVTIALTEEPQEDTTVTPAIRARIEAIIAEIAFQWSDSHDIKDLKVIK